MHPFYHTWLILRCWEYDFLLNITATFRTVRSLMFSTNYRNIFLLAIPSPLTSMTILPKKTFIIMFGEIGINENLYLSSSNIYLVGYRGDNLLITFLYPFPMLDIDDYTPVSTYALTIYTKKGQAKYLHLFFF